MHIYVRVDVICVLLSYLNWHRIHALLLSGKLSTDDKKLATVYLDRIPATDVRLQYLRIDMYFSDLFNTDWFLLSEAEHAEPMHQFPSRTKWKPSVV